MAAGGIDFVTEEVGLPPILEDDWVSFTVSLCVHTCTCSITCYMDRFGSMCSILGREMGCDKEPLHLCSTQWWLCVLVSVLCQSASHYHCFSVV